MSLGESRRGAALATFVGSAANTVVVSIQAVVLIPMYLHYAGPRLYGAWLASGDLLTWIQILDFGIPNLLIQRVGAAAGSGDHRAAGQWFTTGSVVIAGVAASLTAAGLGVSFLLPGLFPCSEPEALALSGCFALGSVAAGMSLLNNAFVGLARAVQDTVFVNVTTLVGSVAGFAVSFGALLSGAGLWAVAYGLLVRSGISLLGGLGYAMILAPASLRAHRGFDAGVFREYLRAMPATGAGGLAYSLMTQSETILVALVTRPEIAMVYNLTKKGADLAKGFVDMIGFASYGGFAHLVASSAPSAARSVYFEIRALRLVAAFAVAVPFAGLNASLMSLWVGAPQYGGLVLTALFAVQLIATGDSYLVNFLYRATGSVERGSWILVAEACLRVPLMLAGLLVSGLPGVPAAAILVSIPFTLGMEKALLVKLKDAAPGGTQGRLLRTYLVGATLLAASASLAGPHRVGGWPVLLALGGGIFLASFAILLSTSTHLARWRRLATVRLGGNSPGE
jgi:O-antigen/teichoic acid export membrane protein